MLAGNIPGALMLKSMDGRIIKVIFGVVIICIALNMLLEQSGEPHAPKKWMTALVGIAAGILSGLFGVRCAAGCLRQPNHGYRKRI